MEEYTHEEIEGAINLAFDTTIDILKKCGAVPAAKDMEEKRLYVLSLIKEKQ